MARMLSRKVSQKLLFEIVLTTVDEALVWLPPPTPLAPPALPPPELLWMSPETPIVEVVSRLMLT